MLSGRIAIVVSVLMLPHVVSAAIVYREVPDLGGYFDAKLTGYYTDSPYSSINFTDSRSLSDNTPFPSALVDVDYDSRGIFLPQLVVTSVTAKIDISALFSSSDFSFSYAGEINTPASSSPPLVGDAIGDGQSAFAVFIRFRLDTPAHLNISAFVGGNNPAPNPLLNGALFGLYDETIGQVLVGSWSASPTDPNLSLIDYPVLPGINYMLTGNIFGEAIGISRTSSVQASFSLTAVPEASTITMLVLASIVAVVMINARSRIGKRRNLQIVR
jgi:hypothetical protein